MKRPVITVGASPKGPGLADILVLLSMGALLDADLSMACRVCGCTELAACPSGCAWAEPHLCTACQPTTKP